MKRLWIISLVLVVLISCGKKDEPQRIPLPTTEAEVVVLPNGNETKEAETPVSTVTEPKKLALEDHKELILERLDNLAEFKTKTDITVNATGGSFLLPKFDISVQKTLEHKDKPLHTHVLIHTKGPIFLNLGPEKVEVYTKPDGTVYAWDESKKLDVKQTSLKPEQVRPKFDGETLLQKRIWQKQKLDLKEENRLVATLKLTGKPAREFMKELFELYNFPVEFDSKEVIETIDLEMIYDLNTHHPISLKGSGQTKIRGYDMALNIQVEYSEVKTD